MRPRQLRHSARHTYRKGGGTRPEVALVDYRGEGVIVKDFSACDPWFAGTVGRFLAHREWRALGMLDQVHGVPKRVARPDPLVLLLEHVNGGPVLKSGADVDWQRFLDKLQALVTAIHTRGVAHGDLRSPHNVLIDSEGDPWIVDFVSATFAPPAWNLPGKWIHRNLCAVDHSAVSKLGRRLLPEHREYRSESPSVTPDVSPWFARFARRTGRAVRRVARLVLTR